MTVSTTPAGEAMREAVVQWLESEAGLYVSDAAEKAGEFCGPSGPIASELARLTERAEKAEAELVRVTVESDEEFAASKSRCAWAEREWHAAEAALTTLRAEHAAEVARLKGALKLAENPLSYRHATDPSGPGSVAVARALDAVRAALATTETTDA